MKIQRLRTDETALLVVDIQERLLPQIAGGELVAAAAVRLVRAAGVLSLPVVVTEQYVKGLGPTVPVVREALPAGVGPAVEKLCFSCCNESAFLDALRATGRGSVLVVGIEAHVCVLQTVLDLLALGYEVFVCADGVGSRRESDRDFALDRVRQAGAVITSVESAIFELLVVAGTDAFKRILPIVK